MKNYKNINGIERLARVIISIALFIIWYFWFSGIIEILLLLASTILVGTGIFWFCPLYVPLGVQRYKKDEIVSKFSWSMFAIIFLLTSIWWAYASIFFTKKFYLENYNVMNNSYKQTLFNTGKDKRTESITNYDQLVKDYAIFLNKYTSYQPYTLRYDSNFNTDLKKINSIILSLREKVYTGDLKEAHLNFEAIRPIFQDILKRNGFSLLAVALVDFHDVMETVIAAADARDPSGIARAYIIADEKLKAVEESANDNEIQAIRTSLEEVRSLGEKNSMETISEKAAELKTNFVKVYLKRG